MGDVSAGVAANVTKGCKYTGRYREEQIGRQRKTGRPRAYTQ